jgi:hypothetical protein
MVALEYVSFPGATLSREVLSLFFIICRLTMRLFPILVSLLLFSCDSTPEESKAEKQAKAVCNCATPLLMLNSEVQKSQQNEDFDRIQAQFEQTRRCIQEQRIKPDDIPEVMKALTVRCPNLASSQALTEELLKN